MTKGYIAPKGAIRNVARIIGLEKGQPDYYLSLADKIAKLVPGKPGTTFADCSDAIKDAFEDKPDDDPRKKAYNADAREVIRQAEMIENVFLNYGMHAAGVIIADGHPVSDYVALMRDEKSGGMKVQCDMVQAEGRHGLLKFDFLGLRNLNIITKALRGIKIKTGKDIDVTKLSMDDAVFKNIFAKGFTGSVFQFESEGMKSMLKKFKPTCFEDLIALVSLYRPGPMDFIPDYINAKYHPESIHYLCPELKPILGKTYGTIVYQEQVMEIFQKLAGYSLSGADNVRRYMSKKKLEPLVKEKEAFIHGDESRGIAGCVKNGIKEEVANKLFEQMLSFASYAFNKSHAAAYAMISYITAWLKYYYPAEYMCAVLNTTKDIKKLPSVLNDCREIGVNIYAPDINRSQLGFTVTDDNGVIFGLDSVKGTRAEYSNKIIEERDKNGIYTDFKEFLVRTRPDKSTIENLIKAGALDIFSENRVALNYAYEQTSTLIDKIADKEEKIRQKEEIPEAELKKRDKTYLENAKADLAMLKDQFNVIRIIEGPEDKKTKLLREKEVLGFFISAHPLDGYSIPNGFKRIGHLSKSDKQVNVMGIIQDLEIKGRKSDGKPMAFFTIEDTTGRIPVCCFTQAYDEYSMMITNNEIVKISGKILVDENDMNPVGTDGDGEAEAEEVIKLSVDKIDTVVPDLENIIVYIDSIFDYNKTIERIEKDKLIVNSGHRLVIYDSQRGEYRNTAFYVSEAILDTPGYTVKKLESAA